MGLLDRYRNPFQQVDPRTGQPVLFNQQPQQDMPWGNDGQAFANMYAPKPQPVAKPPQMPAIRPIGPAYIPPPIREMGPPSAPQQPSMGMTEVGPQDASFGAYNPGAVQTPAQKDMQPQPGDQATGTGQKPQGGLFGDFNGQDLLGLGLSLMGNAQNGGDWGAVGQDLMQIQQGVERRQDRALSQQDREREIKRQEEADARAKEEFGAWRKEQERVAGLTARYEEALKDPTLDPEAKRMLGIMGPEGYGQYEMWRADKAARAEERKADQTFTAGENAKNRAASAEEARIRAQNENSIGRYFQAQDAETIGRSNSEAAQLQSRGLPMLQAVKDDLAQARELGLQRGFFNADAKIKLGQVFNENGPMQTTLETWRARVMGPALETLKGLGAMSEREMIAAMESFANPDMTLDAATELLDERIRLAENKLLENRTMNAFFTDAKGLTGKRNAAGQDWNTALTLAFEEDRKKRAGAAEAAKPAAKTYDALPPPSDFPEGHILVDQESGQRVKRMGKQWVPVGVSAAPAKTPSGVGTMRGRG